MHIKLEYLRTFVAIVDGGGLMEASDRLARTPSAVSMTLKKLEAELGGPLFEGERKTALTPLGDYALLRARRAVTELDKAVVDMLGFARGERGEIRIASVPSFAGRYLPPAIAEIRRTNPDLWIELRDTDSSMVAEAVVEREVDIGVASRTTASRPLDHDLLVEDPFWLLCRADHALTTLSRPLQWSDLDARDFIANGTCASISNPGLAELVANSKLRVHNTTSLIAMVQHGGGVTPLPKLAIPDREDLVALPLADKSATRPLYVLSRQGETVSPAVRQAIALLRKQLQ